MDNTTGPVNPRPSNSPKEDVQHTKQYTSNTHMKLYTIYVNIPSLELYYTQGPTQTPCERFPDARAEPGPEAALRSRRVRRGGGGFEPPWAPCGTEGRWVERGSLGALFQVYSIDFESLGCMFCNGFGLGLEIDTRDSSRALLFCGVALLSNLLDLPYLFLARQ